jgi:hypothetical protein
MVYRFLSLVLAGVQVCDLALHVDVDIPGDLCELEAAQVWTEEDKRKTNKTKTALKTLKVSVVWDGVSSCQEPSA